MNKVYKVIWNKAKHCYEVVSELAKSQGKSSQDKRMSRISMRAAAVLAAFLVSIGGGTINLVQAADVTTPAQVKVEQKAAKEAGTTLADAKEAGEDSVAIGKAAEAGIQNGQQSVAVGVQSHAGGFQAVAVGYQANAYGTSTAIGANAVAQSKNSVALGTNSKTSGDYEVSVGGVEKVDDGKGGTKDQKFTRKITNVKAGTAATDAATVGQLAGFVSYDENKDDSINTGSVTFKGTTQKVDGKDVNVGTKLNNVNDISMAVPVYEQVHPEWAPSQTIDGKLIGYENRSFLTAGIIPGVVKGQDPNKQGSNIVVGRSASSDGVHTGAVVIGDHAAALIDDKWSNAPGGNTSRNDTIVIGTNAKAYNSGHSITVGTYSGTDNSNWATAVGPDTQVTDSHLGAAFGGGARVTKSQSGISVGYLANVTNSDAGVAVGSRSSVTDSTQSVAIGNYSQVYNKSLNSVALGAFSTVNGESGVISVGHKATDLYPLDPEGKETYGSDLFRRITNVDDGKVAEGSHEAVTGGQLYTVQQKADNSVQYDGADKSSVTFGGGEKGTALKNVNDIVFNVAYQNPYGFDKQGTFSFVDAGVIPGKVLTTGKDNFALGTDAVIGYDTSDGSAQSDKPAPNYNVVVGNHAAIDGGVSSSVVIGNSASATNWKSNEDGTYPELKKIVAIGQAATADHSNATSIGASASVGGTNGTALGAETEARADNSTAVGGKVMINGGAENSVAIGGDSYSEPNGKGSIQYNKTEVADGAANSTIVGVGAYSQAKYGTSLGADTQVSGENGLALGAHARVTFDAKNAVALGANSEANDENVVSVGNEDENLQRKVVNVADGTVEENSHDAVTGGQLYKTNQVVNAHTKYLNGLIDAGLDAGTITAPGQYSIGNIALGSGSEVTANAEDGYAKNNTAIGSNAQILPGFDKDDKGNYVSRTHNVVGSTAVGGDAKVSGSSASAFGAEASADYDFSTALGANASSVEKATAVGSHAKANYAGATSLGYGAEANVTNGTSIGSNTSLAYGTDGSVALGANSKVDQADLLKDKDGKVTETNGVVSVGDSNYGTNSKYSFQRRIINVADGVNKFDAVNKGQLDAVDSKLTTYENAGIKAGVAVKNGIALGDGSAAGENGTTVGVSATAEKGATALGTKAYAAENSVALGNNAVTKLGVTNAVVLGTNSAATESNTVSVGSKDNTRKITNVKDGVADTDAATVGQVKVADKVFTDKFAAYEAAGIVPGTVAAGNTQSVALGKDAQANGYSATAIGSGAQAFATGTAIGQAAKTTGQYSVAVGQEASAADNATALGSTALANTQGATALGQGANVSDAGEYGTAVGVGATVTSENGVALGHAAVVNSGSDQGLALGNSASVNAAHSVALGADSYADEANTVSVGSKGNERKIVNVADGVNDFDAVNKKQLNAVDTKVTGLSDSAVQYDKTREGKVDTNSVTFKGEKGTTLNNVKDIVITDEVPSYPGADPDDTTLVNLSFRDAGLLPGTIDTAGAEKSTALGKNSSISGSSTGSTVVGYGANVYGGVQDATAIGKGASIGNNSILNGSVALGAGSSVSSSAAGLPDIITGDDHGVVSVGSSSPYNGFTRRIINVTDGRLLANSHDAVTGGQLYTTNSRIDSYDKTGINGGVVEDDAKDSGSVAIGKDSHVYGQEVLDSDKNGVVSFGWADDFADNGEVTRRLIHVGTGINDSDAATVGQTVHYDFNKNNTINKDSVTFGGTYGTVLNNVQDINFSGAKNGTLSLRNAGIVPGKAFGEVGMANIVLGEEALISGKNKDNNYDTVSSAVVIGDGAHALGASNSVAIGTHAGVSSTYGIAIGEFASIGEKAGSSIAIGTDSRVNQEDLLADGSENFKGVVSVGKKDQTRRIINVADGVNKFDAVNKGQLDAVDTKVTGLSDSAVQYDKKADGTTDFSSVTLKGEQWKGTALKNVGDIVLAGKTTYGQDLSYAKAGITPGISSNLSKSGIVSLRGDATADNAIAVGTDAFASKLSSIAIGKGAKSQADYGIALGEATWIDPVDQNADAKGDIGSVALGAGSSVTKDDTKNGTIGVVSVGSGDKDSRYGATRKIINVTDGTIAKDSHDAVTGGQLFDVSQKVTDLDSLAVKYDSADKNTVTFTNGTTLKNVNDVEINVKGGSRGLVSSGITPGTVYATADGWKVGAAADTASLAIGGGLQNSQTTSATVRGKNSIAIGSGASVDATAQELDAPLNGFDNADGVAIGVGANVSGIQGTAVGYGATVKENQGTAFGNQSAANGNKATAIGFSAVADADNSTVLGQGASVGTGADNSVALGAGSVVFNSDLKDTDKNGVVSIGSGNAERRIIHVADGKDLTDAATVGQLQKAAGESKTEVKSKDNKNIEVVTSKAEDGHTIYMVGLNNNLDLTNAGSIAFGTTGSKLDGNGLTINSTTYITDKGISAGNQVISNVAAGVNDTDAVNKGQMNAAIKNAGLSTDQDGTVNVGGNQTGKLNLNKDGSASLTNNKGDKGFFVDKDGNNTIKGNTTIDGTLTFQNANGNKDTVATGTDISGIKKEIGVNADGTYKTINGAATVIDGINKNTAAIKTNTDNIGATGKDGKLSLDNKATTVEAGINKNTADIANNAADIANNAVAIQQNKDNIMALGGAVSELDTRVDRVGAGAAALAALHPLDYDPANKWDFAAGYGHYKGASAVSVGTYYRPNENTMLSVGGSFGGGENMVNAGVSFKLGGGSGVTTSRTAMAAEINSLKDSNKALADNNKVLTDKVAAQDKKLADYDQKMKDMEAKLEQLLKAQKQ